MRNSHKYYWQSFRPYITPVPKTIKNHRSCTPQQNATTEEARIQLWSMFGNPYLTETATDQKPEVIPKAPHPQILNPGPKSKNKNHHASQNPKIKRSPNPEQKASMEARMVREALWMTFSPVHSGTVRNANIGYASPPPPPPYALNASCTTLRLTV